MEENWPRWVPVTEIEVVWSVAVPALPTVMEAVPVWPIFTEPKLTLAGVKVSTGAEAAQAGNAAITTARVMTAASRTCRAG